MYVIHHYNVTCIWGQTDHNQVKLYKAYSINYCIEPYFTVRVSETHDFLLRTFVTCL